MLSSTEAPRLPGAEPVPGLVACTLEHGGRAIRLYRRGAGGPTIELAPFSPFLLVGDAGLLEGTPGLLEVTALAGPGTLRWLARFDTWDQACAARDRLRPAPHWFSADPVHQFLLATGYTLFGGLRFGDLRRLALDIEVLTGDGFDFPSAARPDDRIIAIALADSSGFRHVLRGDLLTEAALIEECSHVIRERDPDVLEGHNIFRFDLEYLEARARRHGLTLAWGRGGEP